MGPDGTFEVPPLESQKAQWLYTLKHLSWTARSESFH